MRLRREFAFVTLLFMIAASGCGQAAAPPTTLPTVAPPTLPPSATPTQPPTITPTPDYEAEVRAATNRLEEAIRDQDADAMAALYLPEGIYAQNGRPQFVGRDEMREATRKYWAEELHLAKYEWTIDSVQVDAPMATVKGTSNTWYVTSESTFKHGDRQVTHDQGLLYTTIIWMRQPDGTWLIQWDDESQTPN